MKTRSLFVLFVLVLALVPASASAGTLAAQWHLDEQNETPGCNPPQSVTSLIIDLCYFTTPDVAHGWNVGPYYERAMGLTSDGRWGSALSASNPNMPERQSTSGLQLQRFTVMGWVRHAGYPGSIQYIVGEGDDGGTCSKASWAMYTASSGVAFYVSPTTGAPVLTPTMSAQQSAALWDGSWHMVTGTFDGSKVRLYVDGQQIGNGTSVANPTVNYTLTHKAFYMDGFYAPECAGGEVGGSHGFAGDLDDVRVYNRALSASELGLMQDNADQQPPVLVPDAPVVHTTGVDQVSDGSASVNGTIDDHGWANQPGDPVPYHVEYGPTTAYGHSSGTLYTAGTGQQTVHVTLGGLDPATSYHARLVAGPDDTEGEDVAFRTIGLPVLRLTASGVAVGESRGPAALTVERVGGDASDAATVHYATADGSATAGSDYTPTSGTLSFAPGQRAKTITVPITADPLHEPDETLTLALSSPSANSELGSPSQTEVRIADDDALPATTIELEPGAPDAGDFYTTPVRVTVTGSGHDPVETRCVLDRPQAPTTFDDIPPGCDLSGTAVDTPGPHTVYAASRDGAGTGELVSRSFNISQIPDTTITEGPEGEIWTVQNYFSFTSTLPDSRFDCSLDGGDFQACTSPFDTGTLQSGPHSFQVRAVAPGGAGDPTPATRGFTIGTARRAPLECDTETVPSTIIAPVPGAQGCVIGRQEGCPADPSHFGHACTPDGCYANRKCAWVDETCPVGARCTLKVTNDFYNVDTGIYWYIATELRFGGLWDDISPQGYGSGRCDADVNQCAAPATLHVIGDGRPVFADCYQYAWGYRPSSHAFADAGRRISCHGSLRVETDAPLDPLLTATLLQLFVPTAGDVAITATVPATGKAVHAAASKRSRPRIAALRRTVTSAGPLSLPLKLNPAAKRVLKRRHKLRAVLNVSFKPKSGATITKRTRVTLTPTAPQPACPRRVRHVRVRCPRR